MLSSEQSMMVAPLTMDVPVGQFLSRGIADVDNLDGKRERLPGERMIAVNIHSIFTNGHDGNRERLSIGVFRLHLHPHC